MMGTIFALVALVALVACTPMGWAIIAAIVAFFRAPE